MRHRKKINHLGRKSAHRQETLSSMATALILHKRINTTVAKAKALRVYVEPLITKSKVDSTHSRRTVFGYLGNKHAVSELFREVAQKVAGRPGGYTRILKTGFRKGDSAEMCFIELVDYNTNMLVTEEETSQKTTRRGGRRRKTGAESVPGQTKTVPDTVKTDESVAADSVAESATDELSDEVANEQTADIVVEPPTAQEVDDEPIAEVTDKPQAEVTATPAVDSVEESTEDQVEDSDALQEPDKKSDTQEESDDKQEKK
jgi:large subunit ribosomal protein L17